MSYPLNYLKDEDAIPAHRRVAVGNTPLGVASRVTVVNFRPTTSETRRVKYVVKMRPRTFNEIAQHFAMVTERLDLPVDEPDVE